MINKSRPYLSQPGLGWLYVFSSFPPRPPLTSKPFELHLRYWGQRIYRSGKMYWMTFPWPWPKVTVAASINKNLHDKVRTTHPVTTTLGSFIALIMVIRFWRRAVGNCCFGKFSVKNSDVIFQGQTLFWPYLRNCWSDWYETKRKCIGWILGMICDLDLWPPSSPWPWMSNFEKNCVSGIFGVIVVKWNESNIYVYIYIYVCVCVSNRSHSRPSNGAMFYNPVTVTQLPS